MTPLFRLKGGSFFRIFFLKVGKIQFFDQRIHPYVPFHNLVSGPKNLYGKVVFESNQKHVFTTVSPEGEIVVFGMETKSSRQNILRFFSKKFGNIFLRILRPAHGIYRKIHATVSPPP